MTLSGPTLLAALFAEQEYRIRLDLARHREPAIKVEAPPPIRRPSPDGYVRPSEKKVCRCGQAMSRKAQRCLACHQALRVYPVRLLANGHKATFAAPKKYTRARHAA